MGTMGSPKSTVYLKINNEQYSSDRLPKPVADYIVRRFNSHDALSALAEAVREYVKPVVRVMDEEPRPLRCSGCGEPLKDCLCQQRNLRDALTDLDNVNGDVEKVSKEERE